MIQGIIGPANPSAPSRVRNQLPEDVPKQIIDMALEDSELSPRELATKFTDEKQYVVSEATVYRLLKAQDLNANFAYIVIKARDAFHTKTTCPNEMWQTDFTYFKLIGWAGSTPRPCSTIIPATSSRRSCAPP